MALLLRLSLAKAVGLFCWMQLKRTHLRGRRHRGNKRSKFFLSRWFSVQDRAVAANLPAPWPSESLSLSPTSTAPPTNIQPPTATPDYSRSRQPHRRQPNIATTGSPSLLYAESSRHQLARENHRHCRRLPATCPFMALPQPSPSPSPGHLSLHGSPTAADSSRYQCPSSRPPTLSSAPTSNSSPKPHACCSSPFLFQTQATALTLAQSLLTSDSQSSDLTHPRKSQ
ncbi:classical arabinogalactan protein 9-like [Malania oleifera]|uniref:classical arabinogalactan protein 9-like n=1 Tax=Malania oleifera TaxID=397392 RepID=UPI0025AE696C|nr:classical arabinogalactan protein 9-like [Malania oleifera]